MGSQKITVVSKSKRNKSSCSKCELFYTYANTNLITIELKPSTISSVADWWEVSRAETSLLTFYEEHLHWFRLTIQSVANSEQEDKIFKSEWDEPWHRVEYLVMMGSELICVLYTLCISECRLLILVTYYKLQITNSNLGHRDISK
jgi:hypothetical protein